jgi:hypothetical protein
MSSNRSRRGRIIPLLAGARVFPDAQPREWAPPASSSSEGLGNNSEASSRALNVFTIAFRPTTHYRSFRLFTRRHFPVIPSNSPIIFDLVGLSGFLFSCSVAFFASSNCQDQAILDHNRPCPREDLCTSADQNVTQERRNVFSG